MTLTLHQLLEQARGNLDRISPRDAFEALGGDATIADIRTESQLGADGIVPGAIVVARNVLEWRCSPTSVTNDPRLSDPSRRLILMCDEGYQSSLAAATLRLLGLPRATDMIGGFKAWRSDGLPVVRQT